MSELNQPSGSETILVVDDDAGVLSITGALLVRCGYEILQANSGAQALEICEKKDSGIHLLLTDVTMPNMTGPDLAERVLLLRPEIRVLFMSGFGDYHFEQHSFPAGCILRKPFSPDGLANTVRQALDTPRKKGPGRQAAGSNTREALG
jgi:two-component system, cell cycle sensor histidine kinase and response regulator CckA